VMEIQTIDVRTTKRRPYDKRLCTCDSRASLTESARQDNRNDVRTGDYKKRKKKRSELINQLRAKFVELPNRKLLTAELQLFAQMNRVEPEVEEEVLIRGWVGG
jgi:hypothetical protein